MLYPVNIALAVVATIALQAAPATKTAAEKPADKRDKMICKRFVEIGSLVGSYRSCKTKWEWDRERENVRALSAPNSCGNSGAGGGC